LRIGRTRGLAHGARQQKRLAQRRKPHKLSRRTCSPLVRALASGTGGRREIPHVPIHFASLYGGVREVAYGCVGAPWRGFVSWRSCARTYGPGPGPSPPSWSPWRSACCCSGTPTASPCDRNHVALRSDGTQVTRAERRALRTGDAPGGGGERREGFVVERQLRGAQRGQRRGTHRRREPRRVVQVVGGQ
jgi:hypothetical protein